ncbi:unnamed protein product [Sphenostylis stenocarpa]|uniref:Rho GDP-dissociation inhibitor 1 n=1 Tax=Sphenostylis stenocarpa TaxID=92480 RepID=A0AA86S4E5_9FABA|nr:unnamed protein product [Sphenostylis stenocarpa]
MSDLQPVLGFLLSPSGVCGREYKTESEFGLQEQARKALEGALSGKKNEFDKWDKEIKRREELGGGGDTGGGGWFGWGGRFGWSNDDSFWQEAKQAGLTIIALVLVVRSFLIPVLTHFLYLLVAKGDLFLAVILNPLLYALRGVRNGFSFILSKVLKNTSTSNHADFDGLLKKKAYQQTSAKENVAIWVVSNCKSMGDDKGKQGASDAPEMKHAGKTAQEEESGDERGPGLSRHMSEGSVPVTEEEDEDVERKLDLGPQCTLKEQLEKDKDDESLRRWKEQLLGSVDINAVGESLEPDVKILSLAIKAAGRQDIVLPIPQSGNPEGLWFTLKEGSRYSLMFTFQVSHNIVSGLKYTNTVWKTGLKVDSTKEMIGTFSPQAEPYTHEMPEETTPSGLFARGTYSAKSKFVDDDNKLYLEINYTFDIRKDWL